MLAAGGLLPLSFAPFGLWPAALLSLVVAYLVLQRSASWRQAVFLAWLFGVGKYAVGASWIYVSIHEQGGASEGLASVLVGVFVAGMALFSGVVGALYAVCRAPARSWLDGLVFVAAWVIMEWLLTWLFTGFPWLLIGYAGFDTPLAGYAPVGGVLLVSFIVALSAVCAVIGAQARGASRVAAALLLAAVWLLGFGLQQVQWTRPGPLLSVALVQGNIEQRTKWLPENRQPIIRRYHELSQPLWGKVDLIVWPEAAITVLQHQARPWLNAWDDRGRRSGTALVLGLLDSQPTGRDPGRLQNTAWAYGTGEGRYAKQRLVPFGEYVPLERWLRGAIDFFDLPMSRTVVGPADQAPLLVADVPVAMAICYEIAYPELVRRGARASAALLTISNDTWFGASIGPHQHLQLARMRALENGRYVLRATNNGVTAVVAADGRLVGRLPQFDEGVLTAEWRPHDGLTPFTRTGAWPLLVVVGLVLLGAALSARARSAVDGAP